MPILFRVKLHIELSNNSKRFIIIMLGAFARTTATRAGPSRALAADKIKWWAKKKANDGEVG